MSTLRFWASTASVFVVCFIAAGLLFEHWNEGRDDARFPAPGTMVDIGGGARLHLRCLGPLRSPTVVMIAGGGTPSVVSYELQMKVASFAHVCSYDRPGLGWSPPETGSLTFDDHIRQLNALLQRGGVKGPYLLVPESFGSLIAIGYARRYPKNVAGIVFLDGVDPELWFSAMREQAGWGADLKTAAINFGWRVGAVRLAFDIVAPPWLNHAPPPIPSEVRAIYSRPASGFREALTAYRRSSESARPVLIPGMLENRPVIAVQHGKISAALSSKFEKGWAASQRRLADASFKGQIVVAEDASHEVAQEEPDLAALQIKRELQDFLNRK